MARCAIGDGALTIIAGPCVIESEQQTLALARTLKATCGALGLHLIFKASFDKANRTSVRSFRGPGLSEGLGTAKYDDKLGCQSPLIFIILIRLLPLLRWLISYRSRHSCVDKPISCSLPAPPVVPSTSRRVSFLPHGTWRQPSRRCEVPVLKV